MVNYSLAAVPVLAGWTKGLQLPGRRLGCAAAQSGLEGEIASVLSRAHKSRGRLAAVVATAACSAPTPG